METATCIECDEEVGELVGWETTSGLVLCSACFSLLHGPTGFRRFGRPPTPPISQPSRFFWLTGANGEVVHTTAFQVVSGGDRAPSA